MTSSADQRSTAGVGGAPDRPAAPLRILGVDLAAQPKSTGVVLLQRVGQRQWSATEVTGPADDAMLIELGGEVDLIGVDAPLGWPVAFVAAVGAHERQEPWPGTSQRRSLTHRLTDDVVRDEGRGRPMSASADKLGSVAMRCALLQREWALRRAQPVSRDGAGWLVEVYPAASLQVWGLPSRGYKGGARTAADPARRVREQILGGLAEGCGPYLDLSAVADACVASDHRLDALVAALSALAARSGATYSPSDSQRRVATIEGWIHVPSISIGELFSSDLLPDRS